jgi:hypothetical protein
MSIILIETTNSPSQKQKESLNTLLTRLGTKGIELSSCDEMPSYINKDAIFVTKENYGYHMSNVIHRLDKIANNFGVPLIHIKLG